MNASGKSRIAKSPVTFPSNSLERALNVFYVVSIFGRNNKGVKGEGDAISGKGSFRDTGITKKVINVIPGKIQFEFSAETNILFSEVQFFSGSIFWRLQ